MDKRIVSNFKFELVGRILSIGSQALLILILARTLGSSSYGLLFYAISVIGTFQLLSKLGIAKSAARYVSEYKNKQPNAVPYILKFSIICNVFLIVLVSSVILIFRDFIAFSLNEPQMADLLLIGSFYLAFGTLTWYIRTVLQGFEAIKTASILQALDNTVRFFCAILFVYLGFDALGAFAGYVVGAIVVTLLGGIYLYKVYYKSYELNRPSVDGLGRQILEYSLPLTATNTANIIDKRIDTVLVGFFLNPMAVSFYVISKQILEFVKAPISALGFTISPSFGSKKASSEIKEASEMYELAFISSLLFYMPAAVGLFLISGEFVPLIFGDEYTGAVPVLKILSLYLIFQSINTITSNGLDFLGRARERAIAKIVTALLNFFLNILLIPMFGVSGAAAATVFTYGLYTTANVYVVSTELNINSLSIVKQTTIIVIITVIMGIGVTVTSVFLDGVIFILSGVVIGVLIWGSLTRMTGVEKKLRKQIT